MIQDLIAFKRWHEVPRPTQDKILNNVWCSGCKAVNAITFETVTIEKPSLILRGKCKTCGQNVCRVVD